MTGRTFSQYSSQAREKLPPHHNKQCIQIATLLLYFWLMMLLDLCLMVWRQYIWTLYGNISRTAGWNEHTHCSRFKRVIFTSGTWSHILSFTLSLPLVQQNAGRGLRMQPALLPKLMLSSSRWHYWQILVVAWLSRRWFTGSLWKRFAVLLQPLV